MDSTPPESATTTEAPPKPATPTPPPVKPQMPKEIGGVEGPEPTRYGDWQHKGRVTDF